MSDCGRDPEHEGFEKMKSRLPERLDFACFDLGGINPDESDEDMSDPPQKSGRQGRFYRELAPPEGCSSRKRHKDESRASPHDNPQLADAKGLSIFPNPLLNRFDRTGRMKRRLPTVGVLIYCRAFWMFPSHAEMNPLIGASSGESRARSRVHAVRTIGFVMFGLGATTTPFPSSSPREGA